MFMGTRLTDPQPEQAERTRQRVIGHTCGGSLGDECAELHAIEAQGLGLVAALGTTHELQPRMRQMPVDDCYTVEAGQCRQPASHGCLGQPAHFFHLSRPQLHMRTLHPERGQFVLSTPAEPRSQITRVCDPGGDAVSSQEGAHCQAGLVEQWR